MMLAVIWCRSKSKIILRLLSAQRDGQGGEHVGISCCVVVEAARRGRHWVRRVNFQWAWGGECRLFWAEGVEVVAVDASGAPRCSQYCRTGL